MNLDSDHRIAELERELGELRRELAEQRGTAPAQATIAPPTNEPAGGRRHMLKLAGMAAAGATAAAIARPSVAAAADGDTVLLGQFNDSTNTTQLIASGDSGLYTVGQPYGIEANGGGANALFYASGSAPTADLALGSLYVDASGTWWAKVAGGGTGWRKLAAADAAGSFHPITPARVYDSRLPMSPLQSGVIAANGFRTITAADRRDVGTGAVVATNAIPAGATAVAYNLTVTGTTGAGWVAVNPGVASTAFASVVNWSAPGVTLANASVSGVDSARRLTIIAGGLPSATTHVIVDISGYYA